MAYFTIKQSHLFYSFPLSEEEVKILDGFLDVLEESGVGSVIENGLLQNQIAVGKKPYNPYSLFAFILLSFSLKKMTLREMEDFGKYDLCAKYILNDDQPSYKTIGEYINKIIFPRKEEIFRRITLAIACRCGIKDIHSCLFVDGTKLEADANKYKFVWKPRKHMDNLKSRIVDLLDILSIKAEQSEITSMSLFLKVTSYCSDKDITEMPVSGRGRKLTKEDRALLGLQKCLVKLLDYEDIIETCGPNRNSFYLTDRDATAMSLKTDYYSGHGSNFHAAYNVQFGENNGLIMDYGCYQNRADYYTFVPFLRKYFRLYGRYPDSAVADSGYGIETNYRFMKENGIEAYVKFQNWEGESSGKRPQLFFVQDDDSILCLNGKRTFPIKSETRHVKHKGNLQYQFDGCQDCEYSYRCRAKLQYKNDGKRFVELNPKYERYKDEARNLLLSPKGIKLRILRSIQAEGTFGIMKEDIGKTRFKRTGIEKADLEMMLFSCGFNIRKLFRYLRKNKKAIVTYDLPAGTTSETFPKVKPSKKKSEKSESKKAVRNSPSTDLEG